MASKWAGLKGKLPELPTQGDPSYVERLRARIDLLKSSGDIHALTEALNAHRDTVDTLNRDLKETEFEVSAHTQALVEVMDAQNLDSVVANGYRFTPVPEPYPQVKDKAAFLAWVQKNMPENLMLPYPTLAALCKQALSPGGDNVIPPGIDLYLKPGLRRTKASYPSG